MGMRRILLVDPHKESRDALAARLQMLGFEVTTASDGVEGAHAALGDPPAAVVADLWMPSISGAQLCRLLNAEPATADVPVVLRGPEGRRNRFWAERTGAFAYVIKGRMGDLVRALGRCAKKDEEAAFFTAFSADGADVRDRIATYLDQALFDSVVASEIRKLAVCESFDRLFDHFVQFVSQVTTYRWLSVVTHEVHGRLGVHARAGHRDLVTQEVCATLGGIRPRRVLHVEDDDATDEPGGPAPIVRPIVFGDATLGTLAMAPSASSRAPDAELVEVLARELGGALRTATLVEESRRQATVDPLTGLANRRAFVEVAKREIARVHRYGGALSFILFDIDHFKLVNDRRGHASGDRVLEQVGSFLATSARATDLSGRWGGEEFVVLLPATEIDGARTFGERLRAGIEALEIVDDAGEPLPVTASVGVATYEGRETLDAFVDRADRAMYAAKTSGRNRVCAAPSAPPASTRTGETDAPAPRAAVDAA
jgi:two-component system cell cycle response regulator